MEKLEIYTLFSIAVNEAEGDVFLLLPWVLLEGEASKGYLGIKGLDLATADLLMERALAEGGGVLSSIMLPIEGRPPL